MAWTKRGVASAAGTDGEPPALFTSTSRRPHCSTALAMTRSASAGLRMSAATNTAPSTSASCRPQVTTLAPASRKAVTIPAPTPREPPVTTTTWSTKSKVGSSWRKPYGTPPSPARGPPSWRM